MRHRRSAEGRARQEVSAGRLEVIKAFVVFLAAASLLPAATAGSASVVPTPTVLKVASMLTGKQGTVVTSDMSAQPECYGYADIRGKIVHMRGYLIAMLNHLEPVQPYQGALAVLIFSHEARHVRGAKDEGTAWRWAVGHAYVVARLLGASKGWADRMRPWTKIWARRWEV